LSLGPARNGEKAIYTIGADESRLFVFVVDRNWFLTCRQSFPGDAWELE